MKEEKWKKMEELYTLAVKTAQSPKPKQVLLVWKCPKCNSKLRKKSLKEMALAGEGGSEFVNRIVSEAGNPPGVYTLSINHFVCKCGYQFAKVEIEPINLD